MYRLRVEKKQSCYKKGGYESVIFVPSTPALLLVEKCKLVATDSDLAFRLVEITETLLRKQLVKSYPFLSKKRSKAGLTA